VLVSNRVNGTMPSKDRVGRPGRQRARNRLGEGKGFTCAYIQEREARSARQSFFSIIGPHPLKRTPKVERAGRGRVGCLLLLNNVVNIKISLGSLVDKTHRACPCPLRNSEVGAWGGKACSSHLI